MRIQHCIATTIIYDKERPFDDEFVYLHEESERGKFDSICERQLCMSRHEESKNHENENNHVKSVMIMKRVKGRFKVLKI